MKIDIYIFQNRNLYSPKNYLFNGLFRFKFKYIYSELEIYIFLKVL